MLQHDTYSVAWLTDRSRVIRLCKPSRAPNTNRLVKDPPPFGAEGGVEVSTPNIRSFCGTSPYTGEYCSYSGSTKDLAWQSTVIMRKAKPAYCFTSVETNVRARPLISDGTWFEATPMITKDLTTRTVLLKGSTFSTLTASEREASGKLLLRLHQWCGFSSYRRGIKLLRRGANNFPLGGFMLACALSLKLRAHLLRRGSVLDLTESSRRKHQVLNRTF